MVTLLSPAAAVAATAGITFDMTIYGQCVSGRAGGGHVDVVWRDSSGALKAQGSDMDKPYEWWEFCPTDEALAVMPGDIIKVSDGINTRKYVVPHLTLRLDRVNNLYRGTGPAGRTIRLWIPNGDSADGHSVRVGQDGQWVFNPHGDLGGFLDMVFADVSWKSPKGDTLYVSAWEPKLGVTLGKSGFAGQTSPYADVEVSVVGAHDATGIATADRDGEFFGQFRNASGHLVAVMPGDHVSSPSVASDADWIVPAIQGTANKSTEIVTGSCQDTGTAADYVRVWIIRPGGQVRAQFNWATEADGSFVADFTDYGYYDRGRANIKSGDRVRIDCVQTTDDWARLTFVVP